nr:hypothetical protein [Tanacetum cinerariifolium]
MGSKKKNVVVTFDPLALIAEKTKESKSKEKVVVSSDSEGSDPTNNNLRTSSSSRSANKKQEFVKTDNKRDEKKEDDKKRDMSRVKCYNCKKEGHFAKDCKKAKEINANMVFMAQIEKVLSDSEASSSSADEKIYEVSYYLSESESESEFETSEYYDNLTNYGLFVNNDDDLEIFHDAIESNKNLMDINIDALYNILKQNQRDVNDAMGSKKTVVVTSDPLDLIAEKTKVSKSKERVVVSLDSEGSDADDFSELKKITSLLAKAFNRIKFYSKPTNKNLRTLSTSQSANKKQEFVKSDDKQVMKKDDEKKQDMSRVKCYNYKKEGHFTKDCKKVKVKDYEYYKTKMLLAKKDKDEQVLLAEDQSWMESSSDSDQEINANMVLMAQIEKIFSNFEASSLSADEKISEVSYYLSESKSESEFKTSKYYDNSTNYGLFVNNDDDQEIFHDAIKSASENFIENHIDSQKDYDKSDVDHNDYEEKDHLVDKLIRKFNKKIVKC